MALSATRVKALKEPGRYSVDLNFDLYKRITDDRTFGEVIKNHLFDQYLSKHRDGEEFGN